MGDTNQDLVKKAVITAADALAANGKLNDKQSNVFLDWVVNETSLKNNARIVRFRNENMNIDKIGIGQRGVETMRIGQLSLEPVVIMVQNRRPFAATPKEIGHGLDVFYRGAPGHGLGQRQGATKATPRDQQISKNDQGNVNQAATLGAGLEPGRQRVRCLVAMMKFVKNNLRPGGRGASRRYQVMHQTGVARVAQPSIAKGIGCGRDKDLPRATFKRKQRRPALGHHQNDHVALRWV